MDIKLANQVHQSQFERDQLLQDAQDRQTDLERAFYEKELEWQKEVKRLERECRRGAKGFEQMREQLKEKERGVKSEIDKVWSEWEERCGEIEAMNG